MIGDVNHVIVSGIINSEIKRIVKNDKEKISFTIKSENAFSNESDSKFVEHSIFVADKNLVDYILTAYKDGQRITITGSLSYYESEYKGKKTKYINIYCGYGHHLFINPSANGHIIERGQRNMRHDEMDFYSPQNQTHQSNYGPPPQYQHQPQHNYGPPVEAFGNNPPAYVQQQPQAPVYQYRADHPQHPEYQKPNPSVAPSQSMINDEIPFQ